MNKIIFLDIDGILITIPNENKIFNDSCVQNLHYILEKTQAKIVISSSWRHSLGKLRKIWEKAGLNWEIVCGVTPSRTNKGRDGEIDQWIRWNADLYNPLKWVAIDDEHFEMEITDMLGNLVKTEFETGLTRLAAEEVIRKLNT